MGPLRVEFNAHRVFSLTYLIDLLSADYLIEEFSYVDDFGDFYKNAKLTDELIEKSFGCTYGAAIFILKKIN